MRLDNGERVETEQLGDVKVIKGGVSFKSLAKLVDLLGNQMYSNPIGSIIREITSNCFDALIRLKKVKGIVSEDAVIVRYTEEEGLGFIAFIDCGIGMSPDAVKNIYLQILESDKNDDDEEIGGFGVGAKSFLSYTDSINLITRYDGIEYFYIVGKSDIGEFDAYLMEEKPTEEKNGSEVKIAIGKSEYFGKAKDYDKFQKEIVKQLYYFDNVYVDGFELENDYTLFEGETFKFRTGWEKPFTEMHIVLGKVVYPINWREIGLEPINLPVGVKFEIGELPVTINREEIRYIGETKEIIRQKIQNCIKEIRDVYNRKSKEVDTLEKYFDKVNSKNKYISFFNGEIEYQLTLPSKIGWDDKNNQIVIDVIEGLKPPKYKPFAHLPITIPKDPFFIFNFRGQLRQVFDRKDGLVEELPDKYNNNKFAGVKQYEGAIFRLKGERSRALDKFLFWKQKEANKKNPVFLSIRKNIGYKEWCKELGLGKEVKRNVYYPVTTIDGKLRGLQETRRITINEPADLSILSKARIIKEYRRLIIKELVQRSESYDNQIPSLQYLAYLELQKVINRKPKLQGTISINNILTGNSSDTLDLAALNNFKGYIIYGERTQAKEVRQIMTLLRACKRRHKEDKRERFVHKFFVTGKNNFKPLENNPYYMSVEQFMEGNNRLFKNAVTAWYIREKIHHLQYNFGNFYTHLDCFNKKLADLEQQLDDWSNKEVNKYQGQDGDFISICFKLGLKHNLLHLDKIQQIDSVVKWFEGLKHLNSIENVTLNNKEFQKDLVLILKHRGKRLGNEHYLQKPSVIEPIIEAEQLELELPNVIIDEEIEINESRDDDIEAFQDLVEGLEDEDFEVEHE